MLLKEPGQMCRALWIVLRPVGEQIEVTLLGRADLPVELRREVVAPAFLEPQLRVGVELVVLVEAASRPRDAPRPAMPNGLMPNCTLRFSFFSPS